MVQYMLHRFQPQVQDRTGKNKAKLLYDAKTYSIIPQPYVCKMLFELLLFARFIELAQVTRKLHGYSCFAVSYELLFAQ